MYKIINLENVQDFPDLEYAEICVPNEKGCFLFYKLISAKGCVNTFAKTPQLAKEKFESIFGNNTVWSE